MSMLRKRQQKSGKSYYYVELPGNERRQEIAVGKDYSVAITMREELLLNFRCANRVEKNDVTFALVLFREIVVPTLAPRKIRENLRTINNLMSFFQRTDFGFEDIDAPRLYEQYAAWRNSNGTMRVRHEIAFLKRLKNQAKKWRLFDGAPATVVT
jgi:hypothetical protein